nr:reverse transcriptase domain, reverse transcriptase zinc-binding domain protein [Tanacetum cinerariifolium]
FTANGLSVIASKIAVPNLEGDGYTCVTVNVEYEWKLPHYTTCKTFCHAAYACPLIVKEQPMKVVNMLRLLKKPLWKLLHDEGNIHDRVVKLCLELDEVQNALDRNPSSTILCEYEVAYLTAFKPRRMRDVNRRRIDCVMGSDNVIYEGNSVANEFVQHYLKFIGQENAEIRCAMFSIANDKVPGPNVYTSLFLRNLGILLVEMCVKRSLPIKYKGVPLISSRLLYKDCKILIERVRRRIGDWKNKWLSFVGRLQLVKSVLSFMHLYWASVFMLPSGYNRLEKAVDVVNEVWNNVMEGAGLRGIYSKWSDIVGERQLDVMARSIVDMVRLKLASIRFKRILAWSK